MRRTQVVKASELGGGGRRRGTIVLVSLAGVLRRTLCLAYACIHHVGNPLMHQMADNNNLCHHTTTLIGDVVSRLEKTLERMEGKMVAGQEKMETQLKEFKTAQETQVKELKTALEKSEERMEGKMVAGQEKTETQLRELKTAQESINKIAIAFTVAAVVLQGDFIKPLLASFFKQLI